MDAYNVSAVRKRIQILEAEVEAANKREGERPKDRKALDRLVMEFTIRPEPPEQLLHLLDEPPPYLPSVVPMKDLKEVHIRDLQVGTHHRGSYILLKVATLKRLMTAIMAVMEDELSAGVRLELYQQKGDTYPSVEQTVQRGTVCIIKEPYFTAVGYGGYCVRVDHISDIIWLSSTDKKVSSAWRPRNSELQDAEKLKEKGNAAMRKGKPSQAIEPYSQALQFSSTPELAEAIKLNRSMAYLGIGCYDQALSDLGELTSGYRDSEIGLCCAARSLYKLGRFQEASNDYNKLLVNYPDNHVAEREIACCSKRMEEQKRGEFDFEAMYNAAKSTPPCLDFATYKGPIEIKQSKGRGRGVFTTKDVAAGELLLCEKAFAFVVTDPSANVAISEEILPTNRQIKQAYARAEAELITVIVQKLRQNPSLNSEYTSLYRGDYKLVEENNVDDRPIIDTFLVGRIVSLNAINCPRTTKEHYFQSTEEREKEWNGYLTSGIFIQASHFNHDCYSNAHSSFIGDMQIVRASRNIAADTELFTRYVAPNDSYEDTQKQLKDWDFRCACRMCEHNKKTSGSVREKRSGLMKDSKHALTARDGIGLRKAVQVLADLKKTYTVPAAEIPRVALGSRYNLLIEHYEKRNEPEKVIQTAWNVLESLGFEIKRIKPADPESDFEVVQWGLMVDPVIEAWASLCTAFDKIAPENSEKALECAKLAWKISMGEDVTFDEIWEYRPSGDL